jgi:hypothetical protein
MRACSPQLAGYEFDASESFRSASSSVGAGRPANRTRPCQSRCWPPAQPALRPACPSPHRGTEAVMGSASAVRPGPSRTQPSERAAQPIIAGQ